MFLLWVLTLAYACCLVYWMFWGFGRAERAATGFRYNLVPFVTIEGYAKATLRGSWLNAGINLAGNVAMFVPFGLAAAAAGIRLVKFIVRFALAIVLLELLQMITGRGSFDVDDVLLNTVGAAIGWGIARLLRRKRRHAGRRSERKGGRRGRPAFKA